MLKKLLKYDFKAVLKIWWIAAVAMLALGPVGGLCLYITNSSRNFSGVIYTMATLGQLLTVIGFVVFAFLTMILLAVRLYRNFFTDEGYLTFTLPVTRGQLLNSKLIVSLTTYLMTAVVCIISWFLLMLVGEEDFWKEFWELFVEFWKAPMEANALGWAILYVVELIVVLVLGTLFSILFLNCCITFGCIVAKRAKVAASIAIYYVANNVFSFVLAIFFMFGMGSLGTWLDGIIIDNTAGYSLNALIWFGGIAIMGLFCSLLYTLQYWMLDRKLNLA